MKTVLARRYGDTDVLELADVPLPVPGPSQVRVAVEAATVNPVDAATRSGALEAHGLMVAAGPVALGWDAAGTVDAVGPGVDHLARGDRVIALRDLLTAPLGTQGEAVVLDEDLVAAAPADWTAAEAATLPLAGTTALQALDALALNRGEWLLVTGARGAVGRFALAIARDRGVRTLGVVRSEADRATVEADLAIATDAGPLGATVRAAVPGGVQATLDAAALGTPALDATRNGGRFAAVSPGDAPPGLRGVRVIAVWVRGNAADLTRLTELADRRVLTPRVAATMNLAEVAQAQARLEAGGLDGRLVLCP